MARKKKETTPEATTPLQEADAMQEAHLDPAQFEDMNDDTLRSLAQDLGLDSAEYEDRETMIAAIAAVPVIPGPPEPGAEQEEPAPITPAPEPVPTQEEAAPAPEATTEIAPDPEPEPVPPGERPIPYKAAVAVSLAVVHKEVGLGTADMLKPVGTLKQGETVTVTGRKGTYAQLKNGLYTLEAFLEVQPV